MKYIAGLVLALMLTGCGDYEFPKEAEYDINQSLRTEIFMACLKAVPAGPTSTKYNDWDEVVKACDNAAWGQARYCRANCPLEQVGK